MLDLGQKSTLESYHLLLVATILIDCKNSAMLVLIWVKIVLCSQISIIFKTEPILFIHLKIFESFSSYHSPQLKWNLISNIKKLYIWVALWVAKQHETYEIGNIKKILKKLYVDRVLYPIPAAEINAWNKC